MTWTAPQSPRIWRDRRSHAYSVEARHLEPWHVAQTYSDDMLARIAAEGFNGVWVFCQLYDLMQSRVLPQLNRPDASGALASLQALVERAGKHGIGVYLYFNDPRGLAADDPFWLTHESIRGEAKWGKHALCTSTPLVQRFFEDAVSSVFERLHGIAGVILITACEDLTHCWSKRATRYGDDPPQCPRCRQRPPAELVLELLRAWARVSAQQRTPFRVLAWNWEWCYWYDDPQTPIVERLPPGVELLVDMEFGGQTQRCGRDVLVSEYSLSYVGPSDRLLRTAAAVGRRLPIHVKLQINNTHELATVPNIPVMQHLHAKLAAITRLDAAGFMGCWDLGSEFTLNSFAVKLFMSDPQRYMDEQTFLHELARPYFGIDDSGAIVQAWSQFCQAFSLYPLSVRLIYTGPHNDAPGRPLSLRYTAAPLGASFQPGMMGDDMSVCLQATRHDRQTYTMAEVADSFAAMAARWQPAAAQYSAALAAAAPGDAAQQQHRRDEAACATMIGLQLQATAHQFQFHLRRQELLTALKLNPPCDLPPDERLLAIMRAELALTERALPLVDADARLGWHQSIQQHKYDASALRQKIDAMRRECSLHRSPVAP